MRSAIIDETCEMGTERVWRSLSESGTSIMLGPWSKPGPAFFTLHSFSPLMTIVDFGGWTDFSAIYTAITRLHKYIVYRVSFGWVSFTLREKEMVDGWFYVPHVPLSPRPSLVLKIIGGPRAGGWSLTKFIWQQTHGILFLVVALTWIEEFLLLLLQWDNLLLYGSRTCFKFYGFKGRSKAIDNLIKLFSIAYHERPVESCAH